MTRGALTGLPSGSCLGLGQLAADGLDQRDHRRQHQRRHDAAIDDPLREAQHHRSRTAIQALSPPSALRQAISAITAASNSAPKRSITRFAPAEAFIVKKSTMMWLPRTCASGMKSAIAAPAADAVSSKSPTSVQPLVLRPTRLAQTMKVMTVNKAPAQQGTGAGQQVEQFQIVAPFMFRSG